MTDIRYLTSEEIDRNRWDQCVEKAVNGNLYAWSWYLDAACPGWHALATGDYSFIMPLPLRRRLGFTYIYQPFFLQQCGLFSSASLNPGRLKDFLLAIPSDIRYADYNLNFHNQPVDVPGHFIKNTTYHLDLIPDYERLQSGYAENTRRNIRKAEKYGITVAKGMQVNTLIQFKQKTSVGNDPDDVYDRLRQLVSRMLMKGMGEIYGAYTKSNELCAAAFFGFSHAYGYMLVAASNSEGKELSAMFLLIDSFIRDHSGKPVTLDFEGSNISGIARFFAGFGAVPVYYYRYKNNRLPYPVRWLKK